MNCSSNTPTRRLLHLVIVGVLGVAHACGPKAGDGESELFTPQVTGRHDQPDQAPATRGLADNDAILPARIRIHPLTRLMVDAASAPPGGTTGEQNFQIACYLELRDRFGHVVKGLGRLRVELYRPDTGASGGPETQDTVWNIDLRDPAENARVYDDLVTRTYTVYLTSPPEWLQDWARQAAAAKSNDGAKPTAEKPTGTTGWVTLKAFYIVTDSKGKERVLQTSFRLER